MAPFRHWHVGEAMIAHQILIFNPNTLSIYFHTNVLSDERIFATGVPLWLKVHCYEVMKHYDMYFQKRYQWDAMKQGRMCSYFAGIARARNTELSLTEGPDFYWFTKSRRTIFGLAIPILQYGKRLLLEVLVWLRRPNSYENIYHCANSNESQVNTLVQKSYASGMDDAPGLLGLPLSDCCGTFGFRP